MTKCSRAGCRCDDHNVNNGGEKFCNKYCALSAQQLASDEFCACGHAECAGTVPLQA